MNAPMLLPAPEPALPLPESPLPQARGAPKVGGTLRFAFFAIAMFLLTFAVWAWSAPLNSAAIAPGVLEASGGGRRVVQHLEGGIINRILVEEGQKVHAGDPLVQLDTTQTDARDSAVRTAFYALLAQDARLTAERIGLRSIAYSPELLAAQDDPEVRAIIAASNSVFATRQRALVEQTSILSQRLGQSRAEMASSDEQLLSVADQARLLADEEKGVSMLVDEGLERKSRLLALRRQKAATEGQKDQLTGNIARLRNTLGETRAQMTFLRGQMATEAAAQQRDVQMQIAETREKLNVSKDVRTRQKIVAPVDGTVVNLRLITPGAVIGPGQPVLDLVPTHETIMVNARLKANDIDVVHKGLEAEIKLTPYKARVMPNLRGVVRDVSPDATYDQDAHMLYYKVTIEIDPAQLRSLKNVQLISGMPAEVFIDLGSRTMLQYLIQPMIDSFFRAFRES